MSQFRFEIGRISMGNFTHPQKHCRRKKGQMEAPPPSLGLACQRSAPLLSEWGPCPSEIDTPAQLGCLAPLCCPLRSSRQPPLSYGHLPSGAWQTDACLPGGLPSGLLPTPDLWAACLGLGFVQPHESGPVWCLPRSRVCWFLLAFPWVFRPGLSYWQCYLWTALSSHFDMLWKK